MSDEIEARLKKIENLDFRDYWTACKEAEWLISAVREQMARAERAEKVAARREQQRDELRQILSESGHTFITQAEFAEHEEMRQAAEKELAALKAATGPAHSCSLLAAQLVAVEKERDEARTQCAAMRAAIVPAIVALQGWAAAPGELGRCVPIAELEKARAEAAARREALISALELAEDAFPRADGEDRPFKFQSAQEAWAELKRLRDAVGLPPTGCCPPELVARVIQVVTALLKSHSELHANDILFELFEKPIESLLAELKATQVRK